VHGGEARRYLLLRCEWLGHSFFTLIQRRLIASNVPRPYVVMKGMHDMRRRQLLSAGLLVPLRELTIVGSRCFRQARRSEPIADLTERLRHPVRWRLKHPIQAIRRATRRSPINHTSALSAFYRWMADAREDEASDKTV
jgi:hypothetical protein